MLKEIKSLVEQINISPIFNLSLSSRELFHTNFWEWLSKIDKEQAYKLFSEMPIINMDEVEFKREMQGIDLYIKDGKLKIYIENKVKSIPHPEQLERYRSKFGVNEHSKYVLLSLFKPNILFPNWEVMTYEELAKKISNISLSNPYYRDIVNDYVKMIQLLSELTEMLPKEPIYDYFLNVDETCGIRTELENIRLLDTYLKYRGSLLAHYIYSKTKRETFYFRYGKINKGEKVNYPLILVDHGFNNKNATIDCKLALSEDLYIGIQIEGAQYRKFIEVSNSLEKADLLAEKMVWFNEDWTSDDKKMQFCKYGEKFRYQYRKIKYQTPYEEIVLDIKNDISYLLDNMYLISRLLGGNKKS